MQLRILGGVYKNRLIKINKSGNIRPTLVRSRQRIFDILTHYVKENFTFLDVFAGSGIMGMEALSRGASKAIFFDINARSLKVIEENILSMEKLRSVFSCVKTSALRPPRGSEMDVIFCDPPYEKSEIVTDVIKKLERYFWTGKNTLLIVETHKKSDYKLSNRWTLIRSLFVGNLSKINFYSLSEESEESLDTLEIKNI